MLSFFKQKYPFHIDLKYNILFTIGISLYVAFFALSFEPFGLNFFQTQNGLFRMGYGLVTCIVLCINFLLLPRIFKSFFLKWNVLKEFIWVGSTLFSIGALSMFYTTFFIDLENTCNPFLSFLLYTLMAGIAPIAVTIITDLNHLLKINQKDAVNTYDNKLISAIISNSSSFPKSKQIKLTGDYLRDKFECNDRDLLYITSEGNYINIVYKKDSYVKSTLIRSTLKKAEQDLSNHSMIIKCHRCFLVNMSNVEKITGDPQSFMLTFHDQGISVPVSRGYLNKIKEILLCKAKRLEKNIHDK